VGPLILSIDFGTSNTAAAYRDRQGAVHEVRLTTAGTLMPSAVLYSAGKVLVGRTALQAAFTAPEAFEPTPKRRLADREILLAGAMVNVTELAAAVFAEVLARAGQVMGAAADEIVITHPDQWAQPLQRLLVAAAVAGGVDEQKLRLISESQAAAWFYAQTAPDLGVGSRLVVFDFGAGTCDVAALDRQPDGSFAVIAAEGLEGLGGQDMDARIHTWVRRQLAATDPVLLAEVNNPQAVATRLTLNDRIRDAKEALSESSSAAIVVAGTASTQVLQLTRDEFDELIGADIDRAVALTKRVIDTAHTRRPTPHPPTIYLTGGSASIPLVHSRLAALGPIGVLGDPKTVVVQGALSIPQAAPTAVQMTNPTAPPQSAGASPVPLASPPIGPWSGVGDEPVATGRARAGRWWIAGAALVAVGLATLVVLVGTSSLNSNKSRTSATTPSGPTTTIRPVAVSELGSLLLTIDQLNTIMGSTNLQVAYANGNDQLTGTGDTYSDPGCVTSIETLEPSMYEGSNYTAASAQFVKDSTDAQNPDAPDAHNLEQVAVLFPSADTAHAFFHSQSDRSKACAGKTVNVNVPPSGSSPGGQVTWQINGVTARDTTITQTMDRQNPEGWACQRALHAVSNVVFNVIACSASISNQAADIADQMDAKVAG